MMLECVEIVEGVSIMRWYFLLLFIFLSCDIHKINSLNMELFGRQILEDGRAIMCSYVDAYNPHC